MCDNCRYCIYKNHEYLCIIDNEEILIEGDNEACESFKKAKTTATLDPRITGERK